VVQSETGGINTEQFSEPHIVQWKSFDGKTISGWLRLPPGRFTGKRPVIVSIHGGPEGQARPRFHAGQNYLVNEMGVALIEPNIRGSSGYGKGFSSLITVFCGRTRTKILPHCWIGFGHGRSWTGSVLW
jgi:dipeptidyl aminopeptidase/acylaminoacyl peptidase